MISDSSNKRRLIIERWGTDVTKRVPLPVVLIDTRETQPFRLPCIRTGSAERRHSLPSGDYSVAGQESLISLARKTVPNFNLRYEMGGGQSF